MKQHETMAMLWMDGVPPEVSVARADQILETTARILDMPNPLDDPGYFILAYLTAILKGNFAKNKRFTIANLYEAYSKIWDKRWIDSDFTYLIERRPDGRSMAIRRADQGMKSADSVVYWLNTDPLILAVRSTLRDDALKAFLLGMEVGDTTTLAKYADGSIVQVRRLAKIVGD